jgi:molybdenum cofactor biosynthesis protein B
MGTKEHKAKVPENIRVGVITISSTRSLSDDKSGQWISKQARKEGSEVVLHQVIPDEAVTISRTVVAAIQEHAPQVLILTGGTGISAQDVTIEAVRPFFDKELTAFGTLFTLLSFEEIDSAAILSRASAGLVGRTVIFCIPGSLKACQLACKNLIFPELGHLVKHIEEG